MKRTTSEGATLAAICDYLALKGYFFSRTNTSPVYDRTRGAFRAMPKYAMKGWPDICLIKQGKFYGIEVKSPTGKLSPDQAELGRQIMHNGGEYIVARSIDDVQAAGL